MRLLRSSAKRLMSLLVDILDFSKIEAGHMVIESITFDLDDKLRQCFGLFEPLAKAKNVKFRYESQLAYRYVTGDSNRIIQVVSNLLDNALKFTKAGSVELLVSTVEEPGNHDRCLMRIQVKDTGSGIDPASLPRLFSPFTQSDESISRKFGGTGLGLALCKQLCELMGGHIRVDSQLGIGSTFALEIPMLIGYATSFEDTSPGVLDAAPSSGLEGRSILLIDDNEVNQALVATWLRRRGAQLTLASDGESGIRHAMKQRFDAILMDVAMPRLSGIDATKLLRATSLTNPQRYGYLRRIPIIGVTAYAMQSDRIACLEAGMDDHLSKPLNQQVLVSCLVNLIERQSE
jgi:CheY-like chemotaxis protein